MMVEPQPSATDVATVGPLPPSAPPVLFDGHHGCRGGDKSLKTKELVPKKLRLQKGRAKQKLKLASLQARLDEAQASGSSDNDTASVDHVRTLEAELASAKAKLSLSIHREAAVRAASDAATATAIRHRVSTSVALLIAADIERALHHLAPADSYQLVACAVGASNAHDDLGQRTTTPAHVEHPESEHPESEAVASEASCLRVDIYDAEDATWVAPVATTAVCADAAAGNIGGLADFNSQNLANSDELLVKGVCTPGSSNPGAQMSAAEGHETCTPGSSNPGAQMCAGVSRVFDYNDYRNHVSTSGAPELGYGVGQQLHPEAAAKQDECIISGVGTIASSSSSELLPESEATASEAAGCTLGKDINSQAFAVQCEPSVSSDVSLHLPESEAMASEATGCWAPGTRQNHTNTLKDINSRALATQCEPSVSSDVGGALGTSQVREADFVIPASGNLGGRCVDDADKFAHNEILKEQIMKLPIHSRLEHLESLHEWLNQS